MEDFFLPNDVARCDNEQCTLKLTCMRYLDIFSFEEYTYGNFDEKNCQFFIKYEPK